MADTVADLLAELKVKTDIKSLKDFNSEIDKTGKKGGGGLKKGMAIGAAAIAAVGVAAVAAGKKLLDMTRDVSNTADEIAKTSKQLNVIPEQLQRMRGALELSGGSAGQFDKALLNVQKQAADAKNEMGPLNDGLKELGLTYADIEGDMLAGDIETVLGTVAGAWKDVGESAESTQAIYDIFGARNAQALIPLLKEGPDGMRNLADSISATGGVLSSEALPKFEAMEDAFLRNEKMIFGLKASIAEALAPVITDIVDDFRGWITENDDLIRQDLPEIVAMIAQAMKEFLPYLIEIAVETKNFFNEVKQLDQRMTDNLGPAWQKAKDAAIAMSDPVGNLVIMFRKLFRWINKVTGGLGGFGKKVGGIGDRIKNNPFLAGFVADTGSGQRGLTGVKQVQESAGPGGGGASATAAGAAARNVHSGRSTAELQRIAGDKNVDPAVRAKASALASVKSVQEAVLQSTIDNSLKNAEKISRQLRTKASGAKPPKPPKGPGGGGGSKKAANGKPEATLEELVAGAVGGEVGSNLPDMAKRAPTVVVQITRNDVRIELSPQFANVRDPDSAARATVELIKKELVEQNVQTGQRIAPSIAR